MLILESLVPEPQQDLTAICDLCAHPIKPTEGFLWVSNDEVATAERRAAAWDAEHPADEPMTGENLLTHPQPARWRVSHTSCDPGAREPEHCYGIELGRVQTFRDLAGWTLHLMQKPWLSHTDWIELAEDALGGGGGRLTSRFREQWDA